MTRRLFSLCSSAGSSILARRNSARLPARHALSWARCSEVTWALTSLSLAKWSEDFNLSPDGVCFARKDHDLQISIIEASNEIYPLTAA